MSAKELLLRVLLELRPMLPGTAAVVAASLLVLPTLLVCCKTAWVNDPRFRVAGLFFGLTGRDACFLSCAWIKLIVMLVFIVGFQKLVLVQYGMVLLPGVLAAICARSGGQKTGTLLWLVLQMAPDLRLYQGYGGRSHFCGPVCDHGAVSRHVQRISVPGGAEYAVLRTGGHGGTAGQRAAGSAHPYGADVT